MSIKVRLFIMVINEFHTKITDLVLVSANQGKITELGELLKPLHINLLSIAKWTDIIPPEEASSFVENALSKARYGCEISGLPSLADDSGIIVPALGSEPGVHSARYAQQDAAAGNSSDADNRHKLLKNMKLLVGEERHAYFVCVLALVRQVKDAAPLIVSGEWHGVIATEEQGTSGFGYDPIFYISEIGKTAANLNTQQKNSLSHRGHASRKLLQKLSR